MEYRHNLPSTELLKIALEQKEGELARNGALVVKTGLRTGRSTKDRFMVRDTTTEQTVDWGAINQPIQPEQFEALWIQALDYVKNHPCFSSDLAVGADEAYQISLHVITELAWHQLFCYNQFLRTFKKKDPEKTWTLISLPHLKTDPQRDGVHSDAALLFDFTHRCILALGLYYAGEMKKALFSVMNFILPELRVLPMHCAANADRDGNTALFFGLSGTGKTTLSADPERFLIGDDEHGWGQNGIFNFEGGCYAKCINLSQKNEPIIWEAIQKGAILENVVLDPSTQVPDYEDIHLTQNTRASYPLEFIKQRVETNRGSAPKTILFLTCDLYGVLPPVALLNKEQAAYYFLSGYTAHVGSTEMGEGSGIKPTFSACFGAPFFPRSPQVYAELLMYYLEKDNASVYLVNTGWTGGTNGQGGKRFDIPTTRAIVHAILNQKIDPKQCEALPGFEFLIPKTLPDVDLKLLHPKKTWTDFNLYDQTARHLIHAFNENSKKFSLSHSIAQAAPKLY